MRGGAVALHGSIAIAVATAISAIANLAMFASMPGGNNDEDVPNPLVTMLLAIVAAVAAGMTHPPMEDRMARLLGSPVGLQVVR